MRSESNAPAAFSGGAAGAAYPDHWWESFNSTELNLLIAEGLSGNFSLKEAFARLKQARAIAIQQGSPLLPDLSATADAATQRRFPDGAPNVTMEDYAFGLVAGYELDLWGRIRSAQQAAIADTDASRYDVASAAMTVASETADRWVRLVAEKQIDAKLREQLQTNKTFLELLELRLRNALANALDVHQQEQAVARVRSQIPLSESRRRVLEHEIAVLLGKPPKSDLQLTTTRFPDLSELPQTGLPLELLDRRPDIQAAAARLQGADWRVSAARADRLPSVRLSASARYSSDQFAQLLDSWFYRLAGSLTGPIFDGRRRAAEVERTRAVAEERLNAYRRTVMAGIKDVEDALVREDRQSAHLRALAMELEAARNALREATERYRNGLSDYLPVLTALQRVQSLEIETISATSELIRFRIALHRALGGQWATLPAFNSIQLSPIRYSP